MRGLEFRITKATKQGNKKILQIVAYLLNRMVRGRETVARYLDSRYGRILEM